MVKVSTRRLLQSRTRRRLGLVQVVLVAGFLFFLLCFYQAHRLLPSVPLTGGVPSRDGTKQNNRLSPHDGKSHHHLPSSSLLRKDEAKQGQTTDAADHASVSNGKSKHQDAKATIGFAVSVTGCGSDPITEGAAVLKHSIHRASIHGTLGGRYDYSMYAIYHPDAASCALPLQALGYTMLKRDTPVAVKDIQGDFLRSKIESNGCCGEKELIKLEAYTLVEHPIVVHLDLDVLVLQPMDELFDAMLDESDSGLKQIRKSSLAWPDEPFPTSSGTSLNAFFTLDYNMVNPSCQYKPVQGGFLVLRPSMEVYEEFKEIVRIGDFRDREGWGGLVGPFHGSMTFQGIVPYYYNVLHTGQSIELNRCIYNQMCDNPRTGRTVNDVVSGTCRTNQEECEDCRERPIEDVVTTHYTLCQKPWLCLRHTEDALQHRLCRKLHHEWYKVRSELEESWGRPKSLPTVFEQDQFYGFCKSSGKNGYIPIAKPYGGPVPV